MNAEKKKMLAENLNDFIGKNSHNRLRLILHKFRDNAKITST
jgi:hypothetical protein